MKSIINATGDSFVDWSAIAKRLRELRRTMSQVDYGKKVGVPQNVVSRYERARVRPPLDYLAAIAAHGGVTLDWLVEGRKPKKRA